MCELESETTAAARSSNLLFIHLIFELQQKILEKKKLNYSANTFKKSNNVSFLQHKSISKSLFISFQLFYFFYQEHDYRIIFAASCNEIGVAQNIQEGGATRADALKWILNTFFYREQITLGFVLHSRDSASPEHTTHSPEWVLIPSEMLFQSLEGDDEILMSRLRPHPGVTEREKGLRHISGSCLLLQHGGCSWSWKSDED